MTRLVINGQDHEFDFANPSNKEVMQLERAFGGTFKEWSEAMGAGSILALTSLVYVVMRRTNPTLKFDDVEFSLGDGFEMHDDSPEVEPEDPSVPTEPTLSSGTA